MGTIEDSWGRMTVRVQAWWRSLTVLLTSGATSLLLLGDLIPVFRDMLPDSWITRALMVAFCLALLYLRLFKTNQPVTAAAAKLPETGKAVVVDRSDDRAGA